MQLVKRARTVNGKLRGRMARTKRAEPQQEYGENADINFSVAGFWMRFWAFLVDLIVVFSLNGILVYPFLRLTDARFLGIGPLSLEVILTTSIFFLYFAIMTKQYGQTIGKMVFGLRVVTENGQKLNWQQILFREAIGRFLHQAFLLLYLLYITVAFTEKKQGIHDMIADSYVVYERK